MKKKSAKIITALFMTAVLAQGAVMIASAAENNSTTDSIAAVETVSTESDTASTVVQPRKDVIVKKWRVYNGKRQYRRWNDTKKVWVDKAWIDYNG